MNANVQHPLAQLQAAEAKLIGTLTAATARVNSIATGEVDTALETFHAACLAASTRLAGIGVAVRALAGEVLFELSSVSSEIDAALAGLAMPRDDVGDIDAIASPIVEPTPQEIAAHEAEADHDNADPADPLDVAPFVALNESAEAPEQPALAVGHHNRFAGMAHEKYPAVPEDPDDSPSLFATVAACSPIQRDDRPPGNGKRRRKSR